MSDTAHFKTILSARKAELEARLNKIEGELDVPLSADFSEQASELEGTEVLEGMGQAGIAELQSVKAALDRVANGTFGICVRCGHPISEARLDAVPHAAICENCIRAG